MRTCKLSGSLPASAGAAAARSCAKCRSSKSSCNSQVATPQTDTSFWKLRASVSSLETRNVLNSYTKLSIVKWNPNG